jgi:hypothetical protein
LSGFLKEKAHTSYSFLQPFLADLQPFVAEVLEGPINRRKINNILKKVSTTLKVPV